jgi:hypothetical protein
MAHPPQPPRTTGMSFHHTNAVKAHSKTTRLARTILMCIADRCDKRNESWPDMDTLAQEANCTKRSVINALKNIPKDELEIFHRGGSGRGDSNRYRLLIPLEQERVKSTTERVKTDSPELSRTISKEPPIVPTGDKNQENGNSDSNHPALTRILKLFRIPENQPPDTGTRRIWEKNKQFAENMSEEDWELLEWTHSQAQGEAYNFRRKSPSKLIRNLCAEITRSRSWKDRIEVESPPQRPAPAGWAEMILEEYPDARITTWEELPDSMKSWVREKDRERHEAPPATAATDSAMA